VHFSRRLKVRHVGRKQISGGRLFPGADLAQRIWGAGPHGEREPITGVWGLCSSGVQEQSPWWGVRGEAP
jgi:hypothetical protein